ncbi:MAG: relaxase domain-containing protein, partial [Thiotrichales bacterium]|nr:relaxase domain-containing protein [Thiotrichales bacterium]
MFNVTSLTSAAGAAEYLTQDNYYLESGQASSQYVGKGAEALGLTDKAVTSEELTKLLTGELPDGQQVGRVGEHHPGWDATFSAPKSVSVQALVAGDERILTAHDAAVKIALEHYERHVVTRARVDGKIEKQLTNSLTAATFRHETSRALDPQLHSHALVLNITQGKDGDFRSVGSESLYRLQHELDGIYKIELEARLNQLGYQTTRDEKGQFEISSVPELVRDTFSTRCGQVEEELAKHGLSRSDSTAEQRQQATLKTRADKPTHQNRNALRDMWQQQARQLDWTPQIPVMGQEKQDEISKTNVAERVEHSIKVFTEKDAVVSYFSIYKHINAGEGAAISKDQLHSVMNGMREQGVIEQRELHSYNRHTKTKMTDLAITTQSAKEIEHKMLSTANAMNVPSKPTWIGRVSTRLETLAVNSGYFKGHAISSEKSASRAVDVRIAIDASNGKHWTQEQRT